MLNSHNDDPSLRARSSVDGYGNGSLTSNRLADHPLPRRCCGETIDRFHHAVQGRVSSNGHVCATEIIINRSNETDNVQMYVFISIFLRNLL